MKHGRLVAGLVAFLVHAILVCAFVLPPRAVFSPEPLASVDYAFLYYNVASDLRSLRSVGTTAGYDPFFMAGFPQAIFDVEVKSLVFLGQFVPERLLPRLFNLWILTLVLLPPILLAAAAASLRMGLGETVALLALGILQFFLAWPVNLVTVGMVWFLAASYLGFLAWALFVRAAEEGSLAAAAGLLAACAAGTVVHPFLPIIAGPLLAFSWLALRRGERARGLGLIGAASLATLALNLPWMIPILRRLSATTPCRTFWQSSEPLAPLIEFLPSMNGMKLLACGLALAGVWSARDEAGSDREGGGDRPSRRHLLALLGAAATLFALAYYGSFVRLLEDLEPMRFLVPFEICLLVPAARGLVRILPAWRSRLRTTRVAAFSVLAVAAACSSSLFASHFHWLVVSREREVRVASSYPTFGPLVNWIRANTKSDDRILVEEGGWRPGGGPWSDYLEGLIRLVTDRSLIGGPYPWYCLRHGRIGFNRGEPFGRELASYSPEEFSAALSFYAVGWVLVWSPESIDFLEAGANDAAPGEDGPHPALVRVSQIWPYAIYEVRGPRGLFLTGSGKIDLEYGRIRLSGVEPASDGSVVLKLHCDPRLVAPPGMALACAEIPGDPVGFLRIEGAKGNFEVFAGEDRD